MIPHMVSLGPDPTPLEELGIDEIEPGVCEDTYDNREVLKRAGWHWQDLRSDEGELTGLLRGISPAERTAHRDSTWERRKPIMVDPRDKWSEYVGPEDYPADFDMPWWMRIRLNDWMAVKLGQKTASPSRVNFPVRCEVIRPDGTRCWNWVSRPDKGKRCKPHFNWSVSADVRDAQLARVRLLQASPSAADNLIALANYAESEPVRLKANTEILDRVGVRGGVELDMTVTDETGVDPAQVIRDRLARLAARATPVLPSATPEPDPDPEIIDAEVVSEDDGRDSS